MSRPKINLLERGEGVAGGVSKVGHGGRLVQ